MELTGKRHTVHRAGIKDWSPPVYGAALHPAGCRLTTYGQYLKRKRPVPHATCTQRGYRLSTGIFGHYLRLAIAAALSCTKKYGHIKPLSHRQIGKSAHCHIGKSAHCHISKLAHRHIESLAYWHIITLTHLLVFSSCEHRELGLDDGCLPDDFIVRAELHWSEGDSIPRQGMRLHLFPEPPAGYIRQFDRSSYGGLIGLAPGSSWHPLCYDYMGNENLGFRNGDDPVRFEVYSLYAPSSGYKLEMEAVPGEEATVMEPYPYTFYVGRNRDVFEVVPPPAGDTLRLHYYPRNVLREFTFLIYGVEGARYINNARGAVSGMSGSYYPYLEAISTDARNVMFSRVVPVPEGQSGLSGESWLGLHSPLSVYGVPLYPEWFPGGWMHPYNGWTGDWLVGAFATFGPADIDNLRNVLTIEVLTHGNSHYWGRWGYWSGSWEETVREQIAGALAGGMEWRRQNGGFDIVLGNNGRLVVPPDLDGFKPDVNDFDDKTVPLAW